MEQEDIVIPSNVFLEVISGGDKGMKFPITNKTVTIGRAAKCDIRLTDEHASNKHCQIVFRHEHFTAIDLGSLNKTKVNGTVYVQKNLQHNDVLTLGATELRFIWEASPEEPEDVPPVSLDEPPVETLEEPGESKE